MALLLKSPTIVRPPPACSAWAEGFRQFGVRTVTREQKKLLPILSEEDTWTVPAELPLPCVTEALPALTDRDQQTLADYLVPNRKHLDALDTA
jgi:hypothetical protein